MLPRNYTEFAIAAWRKNTSPGIRGKLGGISSNTTSNSKIAYLRYGRLCCLYSQDIGTRVINLSRRALTAPSKAHSAELSYGLVWTTANVNAGPLSCNSAELCHLMGAH